MAHGQWTEVEARGVIEAWRKSGTAITDFARERGIVPQRIYWWRKRLEDQDSQSTEELKLLPVRVVEAKPERAHQI